MTIESKMQKPFIMEKAKTSVEIHSPISSILTFNQAAPQGFGDRQNSWAWSMLWWRGKLYVGTNRAWHCAERAGMNSAFSLLIKYPPEDPDVECTQEPSDLPLQAEIWRWTPETDAWERMYQSPQDVPIPKHLGKYVAREVGYRDMTVFVENDGTEAMYVSGVNSRFAFRPVPAPRLLRSTDGQTFEPVPQQRGTFLGDLVDKCTLRTITAYKERMYVIAGSVRGDGIVIEASNPAGGNDHFRQISPPGMSVFEMTPFNGFLYFGLRDPKGGYAVVKTDATGPVPYAFTPVVTDGAFLSPQRSLSVISMQVFKGRLYVGTDRPGEVIRINPDDSWDLVVGTPRQTPTGWKYPISGLDTGFSNWLNGHIWRMSEYQGRLYIGTWNLSTEFRNAPGADTILESNYGFDLYETADGWHYVPITTTGFGDKFNVGVRSFASTPHGLFVGTANKWYGLQIWRGTPADSPLQSSEVETVEKTEATSTRSTCPPVEHLEVENEDHRVLLSWKCPPEAERFRVWRANVTDERHKVESNPLVARILKVARAILLLKPDLYIPPMPDELWIPGDYTLIGTTEKFYYEDTRVGANKRYLYYVQAEDHVGNSSIPSNIVAAPLPAPPISFASLLETLSHLASSSNLESEILSLIVEEVQKAEVCVKANDMIGAQKLLEGLLLQIETDLAETLDQLHVNDFQTLLRKLRRRVALQKAGLITYSML